MRARVAIGLFALVVGACAGSSPPPSSGGTATTPPPATTTSTSSPGVDRYLALLDRLLSETGFSGALDEAEDLFVSVGERMCRLLDLGLEIEDLLTVSFVTAGTLEEDGESTALGGLVLGAAVSQLCPQHLDLLEPGG